MHRILKCIFIMVVLMMSVIATGCEKEEETVFQEVSEEELDEKGASGDEEETESRSSIFVHVCGQVVTPGVYELDSGSRVFAAIEAAGGMTEDAAKDSLNQAQVLEDGQQLYVPSKKELEEAEKAGGTDVEGKVNINKASKEELMTLSGIGEAKADAIVRYRQEQGNFKSIEEIMEIEGIKEGVFRKIEDQITVS